MASLPLALGTCGSTFTTGLMSLLMEVGFAASFGSGPSPLPFPFKVVRPPSNLPV